MRRTEPWVLALETDFDLYLERKKNSTHQLAYSVTIIFKAPARVTAFVLCNFMFLVIKLHRG